MSLVSNHRSAADDHHQLFTPAKSEGGGSTWAPVDVGIQGSFTDAPSAMKARNIVRSPNSTSSSTSHDMMGDVEDSLDDGDDDDDELRQQHESLNQELAVLLDVYDRLDVALRDRKEDEASPTNDSAASGLHRSASFTSQCSQSSAASFSLVSPPRRHSSLRLMRSPSESNPAEGGQGEIGSPMLGFLRSPLMKGGGVVGQHHPRQSIITLEEPDARMTHEFSQELILLHELSDQGKEMIHSGHRGVALVSAIHSSNRQLRLLEKENKRLEREYGSGLDESSVFAPETLELGNNDIARLAAHHQQDLSRLQAEYKSWKADAEESRRYAEAEQHKLNAVSHKIEFQADHGLRRGESVEDARRMSLLEAKLIDELRYAVHVMGMNLRKLELLKESREIVAKFKSLTPQPRRSGGGGQLQASPGGKLSLSPQGAHDGPDAVAGSPIWAARRKNENPFVSKLFAPENGQEARLLRLRKGALLLKTAPV